MLKLLLVVLAAFPVCQAVPSVCQTEKGRTLRTFGGSLERVKMPCKYNAVSETMCGKYKVWLSPSNELDHTGKWFLPTGLWLRVEDMTNNASKFFGWTNYNNTMMYIEDRIALEHPFKLRGQSSNFTDFFRTPVVRKARNVTISTLHRQFSLRFALYDPTVKASYNDSGFSFICRKRCISYGFPKQICGNGTAKEIRTYTKEKGYNSTNTAIILNVFTNKGLRQTDAECKAATKVMQKCGKSKRVEAAEVCGPIFTDTATRKCVLKNGKGLKDTFKRCVSYICSGRSNIPACNFLAEATDQCSALQLVLGANNCSGPVMYEE